jgi:hypothetical protein
VTEVRFVLDPAMAHARSRARAEEIAMSLFRSASAALVCVSVATMLLASGCGGEGLLGSSSSAVSGLGDPCTPESEYDHDGGGAVLTDLGIDLASTSCVSRVCLSYYFQGRVTCPYGNAKAGQTGTCLPVADLPGLYTLDGTPAGEPCCPVVGDVEQRPLTKPVEAQCSGKNALDSVYCSCRCDVPAGVDRSLVRLCDCPSGFACLPIFDNPALPLGRRGSYCVKRGALGADLDRDGGADPSALEATCGAERSPPAAAAPSSPGVTP